ncbi:sugar porter family MFS transporter [Carboxylicivirga mesophila]|uniref:Sugar porter family MFS transporter n=1 Tax=Carboxylicivirga mesophila TaxID=1166478 RepID=A0ABS5K832_9BACT|nr:sugar porter family MFS transporter [Carboxylicivirga mesophila]MBS2210698.1 sugar porter family MFS transporter [Carboxylicivirga mesophila]
MNSVNYNIKYIFAISMVSAMGGLLFGYDWVVIGGAKPFYELYFNISDSTSLQGWAMSCALIGCLLGAITSGVLSDRLGRKRLLLTSAFLFALSAIGTGATSQFSLFVFYRIVGGIAIGLASNLSPMYIAEVSPAHLRGRFVSLNQLTIVVGILAAQLVNWQIAEPVPLNADSSAILASWNGQVGWRWMFWAELIPAGLFLILLFFVPESPRWLARAGNEQQVKGILANIGGQNYARTEYQNIVSSLDADSDKISWRTLVQPRLKNVLLIGVVLAAFQQWCGINVIFNYAQEVFAAAGYGVSEILFNIVVTGSVNLIFTFLAIYTVDLFGRRVLMLAGAGGLAGIYLLIGVAYYFNIIGWPLLLLVVAAIACYAMSLAPITWVVLSEIFPNKIRGAAMAVATVSLWLASFLLTYTFPILNRWLGAYGTFWLYGLICVAGWVFIYRKLPETKGKTLEELEEELVK